MSVTDECSALEPYLERHEHGVRVRLEPDGGRTLFDGLHRVLDLMNAPLNTKHTEIKNTSHVHTLLREEERNLRLPEDSRRSRRCHTGYETKKQPTS